MNVNQCGILYVRQHTDDVLSEMGCSEEEIARLREAGAIQ